MNRIKAGHYYTRRWNDQRQGYDQIHVQLIDGNWHLRINGVFRTYHGTKADAVAAIDQEI